MSYSYATIDDTILDVLTEVKSDEQKASVGRLIEATSAFIDGFTNRPPGYFSALDDESEPTVRRYRGEGSNFLRIGRHVPGTVTIENVGASLYYEHPENGWIYSNDVNAQPGNVSGDGYGFRGRAERLFACNGLYAVSARWGFSATPDNISMATKQIVQQIWDRGKGIIGQISPSGFVIERDIPLTARAFLTPYIRREFEIN